MGLNWPIHITPMHPDVLRRQRHDTRIEIAEKLGIDFDSIPRQVDNSHYRLQEERLILEGVDTLYSKDEILDKISQIEGIGEATLGKIETGL